MTDPLYLDGGLPVAPSAIAAAAGHVSLIRPEKSFVAPRALDIAEIPGIIEVHRRNRREEIRSRRRMLPGMRIWALA